jgi:hypothetical protein
VEKTVTAGHAAGYNGQKPDDRCASGMYCKAVDVKKKRTGRQSFSLPQLFAFFRG